MEESLVITLGPPAEGWQKSQFYQYQSCRRHGVRTGDGDLESIEKEIVTRLFESDGATSSAADELFLKRLGMPVHIMDYHFTMSPQRGKWLGHIIIIKSDIRCPEGCQLTWQTLKKARNELALDLMSLLKREWVVAFSSTWDP